MIWLLSHLIRNFTYSKFRSLLTSSKLLSFYIKVKEEWMRNQHGAWVLKHKSLQQAAWWSSVEASCYLPVTSLSRPISWRVKLRKHKRGWSAHKARAQRADQREWLLKMLRFCIPADHQLMKPFPLKWISDKPMRRRHSQIRSSFRREEKRSK